MNENIFEKCTSIEQLLYQLAGAASVCWKSPEGAGVFDDAKATFAVQQSLDKLKSLLESWDIYVPVEVFNYND